MVQSFPTGSVVARCLSVVVRRVDQGESPAAHEFMKAQLLEIAEEVAPWGLSGPEKARSILGPTREWLVARHGQDAGWTLYRAFVAAFWPGSWAREEASTLTTSRLDPGSAASLTFRLMGDGPEGFSLPFHSGDEAATR